MEASTVAPLTSPDWPAEEFLERFEKARPRLLAICRLVAGAADADDIVQETFVRASDRLGQLRDANLFEAWLARIALNEARSLIRRQGRLRSRVSSVAAAATPTSDIGLRDLVDQLPLRERMAVVLHYGYGYSLQEVAVLLGISTINARTVLFRARRRLRKQLEDAEGDQPIYGLS